MSISKFKETIRLANVSLSHRFELSKADEAQRSDAQEALIQSGRGKCEADLGRF
jgi:hypothetical protein